MKTRIDSSCALLSVCFVVFFLCVVSKFIFKYTQNDTKSHFLCVVSKLLILKSPTPFEQKNSNSKKKKKFDDGEKL